MSLRVRFPYDSTYTLGFSVERMSDGVFYDFNDSTFKTTPTTPVQALTAGTGNYVNLFTFTIASTPIAQWTNGDYTIYIHNTSASNAIKADFTTTMYNGDDATIFPSGAGTDPWGVNLAGYGANTAGKLIFDNVDGKISLRLLTSTYVAAPSAATIASAAWNELKSAHVAAGTFGALFNGAVASVTAPVTVGTNNDKTGYSFSGSVPTAADIATAILVTPANKLVTNASGQVVSSSVVDRTAFKLASDGLDSIVIEIGLNMRQATSIIASAMTGVDSGAETNTPVIKGAGVNTTRITAVTDANGNRTSVTLNPPA